MRTRGATPRICGIVSSIGALAVVCSCSLIHPLDDFAGDGVDASSDHFADERSTDGGDVAPDTSAPPLNLHDHGSFEGGCDAWLSFKGDNAVSDVARSGAQSCRFCTNESFRSFAADDRGFLNAPRLGTYRVEAWIRRPLGKPATQVVLYVRTADGAGGEVEGQTSNPVTVDETWQRVSTTLVVTKPAASMNVVVSAESVPGACFLVDDVAAYLEPR